MIILSNVIESGQLFWDILKWVSDSLNEFYSLFDFLPPFFVPLVNIFLVVALCFQIIGRG